MCRWRKLYGWWKVMNWDVCLLMILTTAAGSPNGEQLPFVAETTRSLGLSAVRLIKEMAETSEEHLAV